MPAPRRETLKPPLRKSHVIKRSIVIAGHKTSVSLEDAFWDVLKEAAVRQGTSLGDLVGQIDDARSDGVNLSSAIRLYVLNYARSNSGG